MQETVENTSEETMRTTAAGDTLASEEVAANFQELRRRGITDGVMAAFSLSYAHSLPFAFTEGIVIPINNPDGTFSFNKYRRSYLNNDVKQKYAYDVGSHTALFGVDRLLPEHDFVVVTEGEMDALVLWSKNIPAVSSTGGAQSFQPEFVDQIYASNPERKVYVCYDNDDAGASGVVKTLMLLPSAHVIFVPEVVGVKDISDFVARGGDFHGLLQTAKQYLSQKDVEEDRQRRASMWLPTRFHSKWLEVHTKRLYTAPHRDGASLSDDPDIARAKAYPCTELIEFNIRRKAKCLWHDDSDPSLHYYPQKNNCYCHSCGKFADAIDIVMAKEGMQFREAVKYLKNKK